MHVPQEYRCADQARAAAVIRDNGFGLLATANEGVVEASHLPFLVADSAGFVLEGHLARANPQWRSIRDGDHATAIFQGPHAYISPAWYCQRPFVPTWNHVSLHLRGRVELIHQAAGVTGILDRTIAHFEDLYGDAWDPAPSCDYIARIVRGVVGFRFHVEVWDMMAKLSQDKEPALRSRVIEALRATSDTQNTRLADLMARELGGPPLGATLALPP